MGTKTYSLLLLTVAILAKCAHGQHQPIYKQPAHVFPQTLSWWDSIYMYPDFTKGQITYFTDFAPQQNLRLNYNLYYGQMDLVNSRGDTVQLKPIKTIKSVQVGTDVYYLDQKKGYLRIVIEGDLTLAAHTFFHLVDMKYVSGNISQHGETTTTDVRGRPSIFEKIYVLASAYVFLDANRKPATPSKAFLLKAFPEYKTAINDYLRNRSVDFSSEKDITELTRFCNRLRRIPTDTVNRMVVRAHESASTTLHDSTYRFPLFQDGVVVYQDGRQRSYTAGVNYNLLSGEMDVIEEGDTTRVRNSNFVTTVNLDGTTYFKRREGYLEVILNGSVSLLVKRTIRMIHSQALAASSKYISDAAYDGTTANNDVVNFDRMYARQNQYYLLDSRSEVHVPSPPALYRIYPLNKKQVDQYIELHQPDFRNEDDLIKLMSYLATTKNK